MQCRGPRTIYHDLTAAFNLTKNITIYGAVLDVFDKKAPVDLSAPGGNGLLPQVAVDPQGNAVAAWYRFNGANEIVQASGYDAAGPQLRALSIPGSGAERPEVTAPKTTSSLPA